MITKKIDGTDLTPEELEAALKDVEKVIYKSNAKGEEEQLGRSVAFAFPELEDELDEAAGTTDTYLVIEKMRHKIDTSFHKIRMKFLKHGIDASSLSSRSFGYIEATELGDMMDMVLRLFEPDKA